MLLLEILKSIIKHVLSLTEVIMKNILLLFLFFQTTTILSSHQDVAHTNNQKHLRIIPIDRTCPIAGRPSIPSPLRNEVTKKLLEEIRLLEEKKQDTDNEKQDTGNKKQEKKQPSFFIGSPSSGSDLSSHSDLSSEDEDVQPGTNKKQKSHRRKSKNENCDTVPAKIVHSPLQAAPLHQHQEKATNNLDTLLAQVSVGKRGLFPFQKETRPSSLFQPPISSFSTLPTLMSCIEEE